MLELIVLACRDARIQRFVHHVQQCRGRKPVRVFPVSPPCRTPASERPGVVRWLIVDENSLARPCIAAVAMRLARAGKLRIGVRRTSRGARRPLALPAGLHTLAERGAALMVFEFHDQHFRPMKQALGLKRRAPRRASAHKEALAEGGAKDPLHERAAALAAASERVSPSLIQRSLGIPYTRAQRLAEAVATA